MESNFKVYKDVDVSSKSKACSSVIGLKDDQENIVFDSEYVAGSVNRFFTSIASKLVSKLPASRFSPSEVDSFYEANGIRKESFTKCCCRRGN